MKKDKIASQFDLLTEKRFLPFLLRNFSVHLMITYLKMH